MNQLIHKIPMLNNIPKVISRCSHNHKNIIIKTSIKVNNIKNVDDILYLNECLSTLSKTNNTIYLNNPDLQNVYQYLSINNIYNTNNTFKIFNLDKKYDKFLISFMKVIQQC